MHNTGIGRILHGKFRFFYTVNFLHINKETLVYFVVKPIHNEGRSGNSYSVLSLARINFCQASCDTFVGGVGTAVIIIFAVSLEVIVALGRVGSVFSLSERAVFGAYFS